MRLRGLGVILLGTLLCPSIAHGDCSRFFQRFGQTLQQRFGSDDSACKAIQLPPGEFNAMWKEVEKRLLGDMPLAYHPFAGTLQAYADRYLADVGISGVREQVNVSADVSANAFATGQTVTFTSGIIEWYLSPESYLQRIGLSSYEARLYLRPIIHENPGDVGLLAILGHETAHNVLGHPDAFPLTDACSKYVDAVVGSVEDVRKELATGKQPGGFKGGLKAVFGGLFTTFMETANRRSHESDADTLGAWLVWRQTRAPYAMAKALQWLSRLPGNTSSTKGTAIMEAVCSEHPFLLQRIGATQMQAFSLTTGTRPSNIKSAPVSAAARRYAQVAEWYPKALNEIERISNGNLTGEESRKTRRVRIDAKPKRATLLIDGTERGTGRAEVELSVGPHEVEARDGSLHAFKRIVVFEDMPDKVSIEVNSD